MMKERFEQRLFRIFAQAGYERMDVLGTIQPEDLPGWAKHGLTAIQQEQAKDSASPSQIELLKEKLYRGTATRADITRVTRRLGDDIAKVYGFSIPRQRQAAAMER